MSPTPLSDPQGPFEIPTACWPFEDLCEELRLTQLKLAQCQADTETLKLETEQLMVFV